LPDKIQNKKATINIKNNDSKCLIYFLARALDPTPEKKNLEGVSKHLKHVIIKLELESKLSKFHMPILTKDVPKIKKLFYIDINIFGYNNNSGNIFIIGRIKKSNKRMVIFLIISEEAAFINENNEMDIKEETNHYVLIKDFDKLLYNKNKRKMKNIFV